MKNKNKLHRFIVYEKNNYQCVNCRIKFDVPKDWDKKSAIHNGKMFLEIDHIMPLSKGGSDKIENKQCLCQICNNIKSDKL